MNKEMVVEEYRQEGRGSCKCSPGEPTGQGRRLEILSKSQNNLNHIC